MDSDQDIAVRCKARPTPTLPASGRMSTVGPPPANTLTLHKPSHIGAPSPSTATLTSTPSTPSLLPNTVEVTPLLDQLLSDPSSMLPPILHVDVPADPRLAADIAHNAFQLSPSLTGDNDDVDSTDPLSGNQIAEKGVVQQHWAISRNGFTITPRARPFVVEVFAGSGRLTRAFRSLGCDAWAIDWKGGRLARETPAFLTLDLTIPADQKFCFRLFEHPLIAFVHFAPPWGTCSRAREIRLRDVPGGGPPPLRSEEHPLGLPDLHRDHPHEVCRVQAANSLYSFVASCIAVLNVRDIPWSVENPANSLLWYIPELVNIAAAPEVDRVEFQLCAYQGARPRWTCLLHRPGGSLAGLRATCPGVSTSHQHEPWGRTASGKLATSLETVYPEQLCQKLAKLMLNVLKVAPAHPLPVVRARGELPLRRERDERAAAGRQARGGRARRLLPEFAHFLTIRGCFQPADHRLSPSHVWSKCNVNGQHIPEGSRTVRAFFGGTSGTQSSRTSTTSPPTSSSRRSSSPPSSPRLSSSSLPSCSFTWITPSRGCIHETQTLEDGDYYIGREYRGSGGRFFAASALCNPFKVRDCADVNDSIRRFDAHLRASPSLLDLLPSLSGKRLLCHCRRHQPCHGDAIIAAFKELVEQAETADITVLIGVYASPQEFTRAALECDHPFSCNTSPTAVLVHLPYRMRTSAVEVSLFRRAVIEKWRNRCIALADLERELHAAMDPAVETVVRDKNLLVFKEMLTEIHFPDCKKLVDYMASGFPLAGAFPPTGVLPPAARPATSSIQDLWRSAASTRSRTLASCTTSGDADQDFELYACTLAEVEKGWLAGPLSTADLASLGAWVPSRRFGVRQGGKLRAVDDFSASGVNAALSAAETIDPTDVDGIVANARMHADAFCSPLSSRSPSSPLLECERHEDYAQAKLLGRMYDIANAYKHLAVRPSHHALSVITVFDPSEKAPMHFLQRTLPFGASAAVLAFNWVATALLSLLTRMLRIGATGFYDDFTILEVDRLTESTDACITELFSILGWNLKPLPGFSSTFSPLGAVVELDGARNGDIVIGNKKERIEDVLSEISEILGQNSLDTKRLAKLRGRLLFARSLCFGRFGGCALRALNSALASSFTLRSPSAPLDPTLRAALGYLADTLSQAPRRTVHINYKPAIILFTDGSLEENFAGIGAVLIDPYRRTLEFIAVELSTNGLGKLRKSSSNPIMQIEGLAVLASFFTWSEQLQERALIVFVDNESTRATLVSGTSREQIMAEICSLLAAKEAQVRALPWFERVPSDSNLADRPSRRLAPLPLQGWTFPLRRHCALHAALQGWGFREQQL